MAKLYVAISVLLVVFSCHARESDENSTKKSGGEIVANPVVVVDNPGIVAVKEGDNNHGKPDNAKPNQRIKAIPVNAKIPAVVKVKKRTNPIMETLNKLAVFNKSAQAVLKILNSLLKLQAALGDVQDENKEVALTKIVDGMLKKYVMKEEKSEIEKANRDIQALAKPGKKEDILKKQEEAFTSLVAAMDLIKKAAKEQADLDKDKTQTPAKAKAKAKPKQLIEMESLAEKSPRIKMAWKLYEGILQIAKAKGQYEEEHPPGEKTSTHPPKHPNSPAQDAHNTAQAPPPETATPEGEGKHKLPTDDPMLGLLYAYGLKHLRVDAKETQEENERQAETLMKNAREKMGDALVEEFDLGVKHLQAAYAISINAGGKKVQPKQGEQKKRGNSKRKDEKVPQVVLDKKGNVKAGVGQNGGPVPGKQDEDWEDVSQEVGAKPNQPKPTKARKGRAPVVVKVIQEDKDPAKLTANHGPTNTGKVSENKSPGAIVVPPAANS